MFISREKEDDDDFFPNPKFKSNLASIFNNNADDGNSSLTYTAPKQPKAPSKAAPSSTQPTNATSSAVLVAKTVQTFKMIDSAYQSQGKLGAAVVCIDKESTYQLLLYRDKRTHVCVARINRDFKFHIQPKNYASFYDKYNGIWSILFDNTADLVDFTLQVALARWRAGDPTTPLIVQDLWCPVAETPDCVVQDGDSVEITYTIHAIEMATESTEESFNVLVAAEGRGWKQSLIGVRPTTKRLIILQPFMLGDLNPTEIVYNCPVVVKFTLVRIHKGAPQTLESATIPIPEQSPKSQQPQPTPSAVGESTGSPKATKADLITRMARMGQALPFKTATPTISDSDETEEDPSGRVHKTVPKPRTRLHHASAAPLNTSNVPTEVSGAAGPMMGVPPTLPSPITIVPHQMTMAQPYMMSSVYPASQIDSQAQFNMFFSEVRTTNSELRMGITRLTDKVEALQSKLDTPDKNQPSPEMMFVMERLLQHEQQLKEQLQIVIHSFQNTSHPSGSQVSTDGSASSLTGSDRTGTTPATSVVSVVGPCTSCSQFGDTQVFLTERIKKLEETNDYLRTSTTAQKEALQHARLADQDQVLRIENLQKQLSEKEVTISGLNDRLESMEAEKKALTEAIESKTQSMAELQKVILEKQLCIDKLEQAVSDSEAKNIEEVRNNLKEVLDQKLIVEEHAKKIFNAVFRLVKSELDPQNNYKGSVVMTTLGNIIKGVTLEYFQKGDFSISSWQQKADGTKVLAEPLENASADNQVMSEGQYVRKEQRSPMPVEAKLSAGICNEVNSQPKTTHQNTDSPSQKAVSAHQDASTQPSPKDISIIADKIANFSQEDSLTSVVLVDERRPEASSNLRNTDLTEDSIDAWKPQPPPPPLFEDEESDDTWLNS